MLSVQGGQHRVPSAADCGAAGLEALPRQAFAV